MEKGRREGPRVSTGNLGVLGEGRDPLYHEKEPPFRRKRLKRGEYGFREHGFKTPNSVSFFDPHRVPGGKLSEFLSAYYLCAKANSPSFSQNSPSLLQNSVRLSEFSSPKQYSRNSILPVFNKWEAAPSPSFCWFRVKTFCQKNSRRLWRSRRRKSSSVPEGVANFPAAVSLPESAQTLAGDSFSCCRKIGEESSSSVEICPKTFPARYSDSHSLLEFSEFGDLQAHPGRTYPSGPDPL